jgi:hypothetical protein
MEFLLGKNESNLDRKVEEMIEIYGEAMETFV